MRKVYSSIDIGSDTIKFIVGEYFEGKINVLASYSIKSKGVRKGLIVDSNLATNAIKDGLKYINDFLGFDIKKVIVNVPGYNAKFIYVTGSIDVTNSDEIITTEDVNKVIKASVYNKLPSDYELVTVVPIKFILDNTEQVDKPVGKTSKKLDLKGIMVATPKKNIYSVISVIEAANLEIADITLSGLADYYEVRNDALDKSAGAIINIGHETTNVSIFKEGKLVDTDIIQLGGINIEKDLAYVFGISVFDGRTIKEKFASSNKRFCTISEIYEVKNTIGEELKLNQLEVSEVVQNRLEEILEYAKKKVLELTKHNISYLVITGGITEIKSFKNLVFEFFGKDVIIYSTNTLGVRNNKYTTSLGMIKYFINKMDIRGKEYSMISNEDNEKLLNPDQNVKRENVIFNRILGSLHASKEEKNE